MGPAAAPPSYQHTLEGGDSPPHLTLDLRPHDRQYKIAEATPSTIAGSPLEIKAEQDPAEAISLPSPSYGSSVESQLDLRRQLCDQNLFVFHLPSDWREGELQQAFAAFGSILSAKVVKRPDGSSKGYGFVCFAHKDDAVRAVEEMNGYSVGGKRLKVSLKKTPEECLNLQVQKLMSMSEQNDIFDRDRDCSLFVFHLPPHWDDDDLRERFLPYGPVIAAKVSRKEDGTSRGYGFVTCTNPRSAALAILHLNGLEVCNKRLKVQPKQMGSTVHPKPDCTVFVFHLPNDWTDAILRQFFSHSGRVVGATVQRDTKGRSRGFGFVTFDRAQAARDAVVELNGITVGIKRLKVSLKRTNADGHWSRTNVDFMTPSHEQWGDQSPNESDGEFDGFIFDEAGNCSQVVQTDCNRTPQHWSAANSPTGSSKALKQQADFGQSHSNAYPQTAAAFPSNVILSNLMTTAASQSSGRSVAQHALSLMQHNLLNPAALLTPNVHQQQHQQFMQTGQGPQLLPYGFHQRPALWGPPAAIPYATTHPSLAASATPTTGNAQQQQQFQQPQQGGQQLQQQFCGRQQQRRHPLRTQ